MVHACIIKKTVQEEIRHKGQNNNKDIESASTSSRAAACEPSNQTVSQMSGLLDRIRGHLCGRKRKTDKEHQIQVCRIHYEEQSEV